MKTKCTHQLKAQAFERIMQYHIDYKESDHSKVQRFCKAFIKQDLALLKQLR